MSTMTPTAPMTYSDALDEHRAAIETISGNCEIWKTAAAVELLECVQPGRTHALAAAQAAFAEVQTAVSTAAERLAAHDANKPALDGVGAWARVLATLRDEASAFSAIAEQRRAAVADAADAVFMEREAAWVVLKNEVAFDNNRAFDAATMDISVQLLEVERAKGRQGQAFHKRMMWENAIESLKPRR